MKRFVVVSLMVMFVTLLSACEPTEVTCGEGTILEDGYCVKEEEPEPMCGEGTELIEGECVPTEEPTLCEEGYSLVDDQCVLDEVEPIVCDEGYSLVDGTCVLDEVEPIVCDEGYTLIDDTCVLDEPVVVDTCSTDLSDYGAVASTFELVWADEFDYEGMLDDSKWEYLIGNGGSYGLPGWGNNELQYYSNSLDNVKVEDGVLKITASTDGYAQYDYTSGRVRTMNKADFKYGVYEVCAKMPNGLGTWPAIWMLPTNSPHGGWPYGGEIDIM